MNKLIKLSETHYVIVDDSEIKENNWYWTPIKRSIEQCIKKILVLKNNQNDVEQLKITHSTEPLENKICKCRYGLFVSSSHPCKNECKHPDPELVFDKIKHLSLIEVEETIYGYSVEKITEPIKKEFGVDCEYWYYIEGFKKHKEITKERLFTIKDMKNAIKMARERITHPDWDYVYDTDDEIVNKLLPKTEWDIEFDEKGKIKLI